MPIARVNGASIYFEIYGHRGPWVATISGGRSSHSELKELALAIAACGHRVVVYDRRNSGRSSLDFDSRSAEEDVEANDLAALLKHIGVRRGFVIGMSRGARIAISYALHWPRRTSGIGLWGLSGGADTTRSLLKFYYGQYVRAAERKGMEGVCSQGSFAELAGTASEQLLALDPAVFCSAMRRWRDQFSVKTESPIIGFSDEELGTIRVPTAIMPRYDSWHPLLLADHARTRIEGSQLFEYQPTRIDASNGRRVDYRGDIPKVAAILCSFMANLPKHHVAQAFDYFRRMVPRRRMAH